MRVEARSAKGRLARAARTPRASSSNTATSTVLHRMGPWKAATTEEVVEFATASGRLRALVYSFGAQHGQCPQRWLGTPVTAKTVVPSLRGNHGTGLASIADGFLPHWPRIPVAATAVFSDDASRRALDPAHFAVNPRDVAPGAHVLVLEDTWVTGGHSQALAVALKQAGAAIVTIVPICKLLNSAWPPNRTYGTSTHRRPWSPDTCPVTGSTCP